MAILPDSVLGLHVSTWLLVVVPIAIVLYIILWMVYAVTLHPLAKVPGPFWASVTRLWYIHQIYTGDMDKAQRALHKEHGLVVRIAPNEVSSANPADIPKIYRNHDPLSKTDSYPIWGAPQISKQPDLFTCTDEEEHARYRKVVAPVYSLGNVLKHEDHCWEVYQSFSTADDGIRGQEGNSRPKQIAPNKNRDIGGWIGALDALMPVLCVAAIAPTYYRTFIMISAIAVPTIYKALKPFEGVATAAIHVVTKRRKEISEGNADRIDILQQLSKIVREKSDQVIFTDSEVTLEAYIAVLGCSDTTAIALRASLYYLMKHPGPLAKCRSEIDQHRATLSSPIRYAESIALLPYTGAAIKEAMRLFPSVGLSMQRHAPATGIELSGYFIPPGWRSGCNPCITQHDRGVFGDDADDFRPERWFESEERSKEMEKALLVFGAGTRTCIGKNIANTEIHTLVPELLRHFDIHMAHEHPWKTADLWFHKQSDMLVNFKCRA